MINLLKSKKYNSGKRPSQHNIGKKSFLKNNGGAIPSNFISLREAKRFKDDTPSNVITLTNTQAFSRYLLYCRKHSLDPHPARMPIGLPEFFIKLLTEPGGLVLDPFGGSNTTGAAAERLARNWITIEARWDYIKASRGRFDEGRRDSKKEA
jgi:site-specific DNA-methyltransferase (cytosine-N4-specific)